MLTIGCHDIKTRIGTSHEVAINCRHTVMDTIQKRTNPIHSANFNLWVDIVSPLLSLSLKICFLTAAWAAILSPGKLVNMASVASFASVPLGIRSSVTVGALISFRMNSHIETPSAHPPI